MQKWRQRFPYCNSLALRKITDWPRLATQRSTNSREERAKHSKKLGHDSWRKRGGREPTNHQTHQKNKDAVLAKPTSGNQSYFWHCSVPEEILVPWCWAWPQHLLSFFGVCGGLLVASLSFFALLCLSKQKCQRKSVRLNCSPAWSDWEQFSLTTSCRNFIHNLHFM